MDALKKFAEFSNFKDKFVSEALESAFFCEKREHEKCRPLVKISSEKDLIELNKNIAYWTLTVNELVSADPIRFRANASIFAPLPSVIIEPSELFIRKNKAVSTRKLSREYIIERLQKKIDIELLKNDNFSNLTTENLKKEIIKFKRSVCDTYRLRSEGYDDYVIIYKLKDGKPNKIRLSRNGIFFYDPSNKCKISFPEDSRTKKTRSDNYEDLGLAHVNCSLYDGSTSVLLKENEVIKARKAHAKHRMEILTR